MDDTSGFAPDLDDYGDEEDEWFGDGSAFDSGEDLAAALFAIAGVAPPEVIEVVVPAAQYEPTFEVAHDIVFDRPPPGPAAPATTAADFQFVDRPVAKPQMQPPAYSEPIAAASAAPPPTAPGQAPVWGVRPHGTGRAGWSMRHSVQFLKMTEEVMRRLRNDAVELTWNVASLAVAQADIKPSKRQP